MRQNFEQQIKSCYTRIEQLEQELQQVNPLFEAPEYLLGYITQLPKSIQGDFKTQYRLYFRYNSGENSFSKANCIAWAVSYALQDMTAILQPERMDQQEDEQPEHPDLSLVHKLLRKNFLEIALLETPINEIQFLHKRIAYLQESMEELEAKEICAPDIDKH